MLLGTPIARQRLAQKLRKPNRRLRLVESFPTIPRTSRNSQKSPKSRYSVHHFSRHPLSRPNAAKQLGLPTIGKKPALTQLGLWVELGIEAEKGGCLRHVQVSTGRLALQPAGQGEGKSLIRPLPLAGQGSDRLLGRTRKPQGCLEGLGASRKDPWVEGMGWKPAHA